MAINVGQKGKSAEREVALMLREAIEWAYTAVELERELAWLLVRPVIERNLSQAASGGYDVKGIDWMACEVKHHATTGAVNTWWAQAVRQASGDQMPVLFYKGNKLSWRVRTVGTLQGMPARGLSVEHWCVVDVTLDDFMRYVRKRLKSDAEEQYLKSEHG